MTQSYSLKSDHRNLEDVCTVNGEPERKQRLDESHTAGKRVGDETKRVMKANKELNN